MITYRIYGKILGKHGLGKEMALTGIIKSLNEAKGKLTFFRSMHCTEYVDVRLVSSEEDY